MLPCWAYWTRSHRSAVLTYVESTARARSTADVPQYKRTRDEMLEKIALLLIGGIVTFVVQRLLASRNEKKAKFQIHSIAFRGFPDFHRQLLYKNFSNDVWEQAVPSELRDRCITFVCFFDSVGTAVAKDVRMTVHAKNGAGIVVHQFLVDRTAICGRLDTKQNEDKELVCTWKYINPGDEIELHLLVTGIDDPKDIEIGIDGEGISGSCPLYRNWG
jgi:hypothetical protein